MSIHDIAILLAIYIATIGAGALVGYVTDRARKWGITTTDLFKTTADQLLFALSKEWCDLYSHKSKWTAEAERAEDEANEALHKANIEDEGDKLTDAEVDQLYSLAEALDKDARAKRARVDRLEEAMEAIEKLETFYSEDWKEV